MNVGRLFVVLLMSLLVCLPVGCREVTAHVGEGEGEGEQAVSQEDGPLNASPQYAANGPIGGDSAQPRLMLMKYTLGLVKSSYYDLSRVDWRKMMTHAFDALQTQLVEVVSDFDAPLEDGPDKVRLRVNTRTRDYDLTQIHELSDVHEMSVDVASFVLSTMREEMKARDLEYLLINGMLDTLDPHSVLLTPKMYEDMQTTHGGFGGLGIVIGIRDDELTVISPIEGTPASRAGLRAGDKITQIGEESTVNMPLHEAVDRLRGEVGTSVTIAVMRKSWTEPRPFVITRDHIRIRSLITQALPKEKFAYIKIKSFEKNTAQDIRQKLEEMRKEMGEIRGLVLDLRYNAGGLLSQAIAVADLFLDDGKMIVTSEGVGGKERDENTATDTVEPDYPIVVIVNAGSASASEIVAGALKNHDRAVTIGDQTFGKGSVQILRDNDDGSAIKLTIAQYLTPGDISIQGVGIAPDVHVVPVLASEEDGLDLFASEHIRREKTLELALENEKVKKGDKPLIELAYLHNEEEEEGSGEDYSEDFEIRLAKRMLVATNSPARTDFLRSTSALLERITDEETGRIIQALGSLGIDWNASDDAAPQPFDVTFEVVGAESGRPYTLTAGETVNIEVTVTNTGSRDISRLYAITHSNNPVYDDRELVFGRVAAGASRSFDLEMKIPKGGETRQDTIHVSFGDINGELNREEVYELVTMGLPRPAFAYTYQVDDRSGGNGDGLLQAGETVDFVVHVHNIGQGDSAEALAFMQSNSGAALYLAKGRETIGPIATGDVAHGRLKFEVKGPKENSDFVEFDLTVYDKDFGARVAETIELKVYDTSPELQSASNYVEAKLDTPLWSGASEESLRMGTLPAGTVLTHDATSADGAFYRVTWTHDDQTLMGWAKTGSLHQTEASPTGTPELTPAHSAPLVSFAPTPNVVDAENYEVTGTITDDGTVADYRVYVWHRNGSKTNTRKLDFGVGGRGSKQFAVEVPLREGVNRVTLVARDDEKLERSETIYIARP